MGMRKTPGRTLTTYARRTAFRSSIMLTREHHVASAPCSSHKSDSKPMRTCAPRRGVIVRGHPICATSTDPAAVIAAHPAISAHPAAAADPPCRRRRRTHPPIPSPVPPLSLPFTVRPTPTFLSFPSRTPAHRRSLATTHAPAQHVIPRRLGFRYLPRPHAYHEESRS